MAEPVEEPKSDKMVWYILKVQSNREESIREALLRRVAIAGLGHYFGDVIVPTEKVTEFKGGKKKVIERKLYPGYLVVHMEINDDTWFLVRETPGIGDSTGASGIPAPCSRTKWPALCLSRKRRARRRPIEDRLPEGERVKINDTPSENFEGEVDNIDETNGRVTVMINIFGRSTPVELEYWQIEAKGSEEITHNIGGVTEASHSTAASAQESQQSAQDLVEMAAQLRNLVAQFNISDSGAENQYADRGHGSARAAAAGTAR